MFFTAQRAWTSPLPRLSPLAASSSRLGDASTGSLKTSLVAGHQRAAQKAQLVLLMI